MNKQFWEKVLEEYESEEAFSVYLCNSSDTFKNVWEKYQENRVEIANLANKFLADKVEYEGFEASGQGILFYISDETDGPKYHKLYFKKENIRLDFLKWCIQFSI